MEENELKQDNGEYLNGEDTASKTVAPQGVEGSNPSLSADKPKRGKKVENEPTITLYRLNFRRPNGDIRSDIPKAVVYSLASNWSDLLRIIPANRWSTLEEIVQMVWEWESRQYRKLYTRTRKQIEDGVQELTEAGVIQTKEK